MNNRIEMPKKSWKRSEIVARVGLAGVTLLGGVGGPIILSGCEAAPKTITATVTATPEPKIIEKTVTPAPIIIINRPEKTVTPAPTPKPIETPRPTIQGPYPSPRPDRYAPAPGAYNNIYLPDPAYTNYRDFFKLEYYPVTPTAGYYGLRNVVTGEFIVNVPSQMGQRLDFTPADSDIRDVVRTRYQIGMGEALIIQSLRFVNGRYVRILEAYMRETNANSTQIEIPIELIDGTVEKVRIENLAARLANYINVATLNGRHYDIVSPVERK